MAVIALKQKATRKKATGKTQKTEKPPEKRAEVYDLQNRMLEANVRAINFLSRTYDGLNKLIVSTKNRIQAINKEADTKHEPLLKGYEDDEGNHPGMENLKQKILRDIHAKLTIFPIYNEWLKKVPGIGVDISCKLILSYYFRFTPICSKCNGILEKQEGGFKCEDCGTKAKGEGVLNHRVGLRDFPNISKWWAFMGVHCDENGIKPKRKAGEVSKWSSKRRTTAFMIGDQFNRYTKRDHPYARFLLERKERHRKKNASRKDPWSDGHILNAAKNEASKLFLAHFWAVAREIDGKTVTAPYAGVIMGHTGIIDPYFWK